MKKRVSLVLALVVMFSMVLSFSYANAPSKWSVSIVDKGTQQGFVHKDLMDKYQSEITRAECCKLLVHLYVKESGIKDVKQFMKTTLKQNVNEYKYPFKDVDYKNPDSDYIVVAHILGFTGGTSATTFSPNMKLTREQAAKIIFGVFKKLDAVGGLDYDNTYSSKYKNVTSKFSDDSQIADWAREDVYQIRNLGIMGGVGDNKFNPKGIYTREQAIVTAVTMDDVSEHMVEEYKKDLKKQVVNPNLDAVQTYDNDLEQTKSLTKKEIKQMKKEVLRLTNKERKKRGLKPLSKCSKYANYADVRANEIIEKFSHTRPDGSSCFSGMSNYKRVAENIAWGQQTPEEVVDSWMNSPGHRDNILNPNLEQLAVGISNDNGDLNWVQVFYTPWKDDVQKNIITQDDINKMKKEVFILTNEERLDNGLKPLSICTQYADYADIRAREIIEKYSHTRPDGSSCFSGMSNYMEVAENIYKSPKTAQEAVSGWMNSSGHRANILNPNLEQLAVGISNDNGELNWVQVFYTPKPEKKINIIDENEFVSKEELGQIENKQNSVGDNNQSSSGGANDDVNDNEEDYKPTSREEFENMKDEVLRLTNKERKKRGLKPLSKCSKYSNYADVRADEIIEKFSHTRPDGSSCFSGMSNYKRVAENIAWGQQTPEEVVYGWMNSPGHRANILNPDLDQLAVGIGNDNGTLNWVQVFYTPSNSYYSDDEQDEELNNEEQIDENQDEELNDDYQTDDSQEDVVDNENQIDENQDDDVNDEDQSDKSNDDVNSEEQADDNQNDDSNNEESSDENQSDDVNNEDQTDENQSDDVNSEDQTDENQDDDVNSEDQTEENANNYE